MATLPRFNTYAKYCSLMTSQIFLSSKRENLLVTSFQNTKINDSLENLNRCKQD